MSSISLVLVIAWIGFAVRTWQAYDAPVQVAGDCFISTVGKDWAAGCIVGGRVSSQSAVSWKKLACFYSHFCQVVNVKVVDAIPAKWIQVRKVPARPRPVQEDSFAVFFAGWDSCFLASHERSWQPESLFTTWESEAKEKDHIQSRVITAQLKYCEMNWTSWGAQLPSTSSLRLDTAMLGSEWETNCICTFRLRCFSIVMNSTIWTKIQQNP